MKINFTKKQYEHLILISELAGSVLGVAGDDVDNKKYKKISDEHENFESYLLGFAKDFGLEEIVDEYDGEKFLNEDVADKHFKIMEEYDEFIMWDELANNLARREFYRTATEDELKECEKEGLLNIRFMRLIDKNWKEFEKNGLDNFEIKK